MAPPTFEKVIEQREIGEDLYETVRTPLWTWPGSPVIPGGTLMAIAAAAAYKTVSSDFSIDSLQANFLSFAKFDVPLQQRVRRLSDGGRFATRVVTMEQGGTVMVHIVCSFVRTSAMTGPSMKHCVGRATMQTVESITLDDLEVGKTQHGPHMKYQRLPIVYTGRGQAPQERPPGSMTYPSVATMSAPLSKSDARIQGLGIIGLSDYHVLDCCPTVNGISFGLPAINDTTQIPLFNWFQLFTSLNHSIQFHAHDGFRADDLCYIEANSPWTSGRRGEIQSRIFDRGGKLIATCKQESYYVMKEKKEGSKL